jgi:transcriptional regulator with XRE-family HTH domain
MDHMKARARAAIIGFGRRVREHRRAAGISQGELGQRSRVSLDFISRIERGNSNPSLETMMLVACALECDLTTLLRPESGSVCVTLREDDMRRAQDAINVICSVLAVGP